jgi:hypothetical protein
MSEVAIGALFAILLFAGSLGLIAVGRSLRIRDHARHGTAAGAGLGPVESGVFALMGLLLAFSFSGAGQRFNERRMLVIEEINAIGTAYARLDLLPADARENLRTMFREYVDERLALHRAVPRSAAAEAAIQRTLALQNRIWTSSVVAVNAAPNSTLAGPLLAAVGEMHDSAVIRLTAATIHPPWIVFALLGAAVLGSSLLAGYSMGSGHWSWMHAVGFAALLAATVYVTIDLEYPRLGLFQISATDQLLEQLRARM